MNIEKIMKIRYEYKLSIIDKLVILIDLYKYLLIC